MTAGPAARVRDTRAVRGATTAVIQSRRASRVARARCAAVEVGTAREKAWFMLTATETATSATEQDLRPRARTLSWMASLSVAAGELRAAEGYLLELLAWCAFGDRDPAVADSEL